MSKQPTEARREVGNTDLEIVDRAIADHETFQTRLYTLRRVLSEVGKLDEQYRGLKQAIEQVQAEGANIARQLEQAKADLATAQREAVEKRQELAMLTAEVAEKERTLSAYSAQIDRITGKAA
jgi:chromosome segregation ATPase